MANDIKNWAKRQTVGDRAAKSVLLELADCANEDGYLWYAIPTIAATLEASPKTVERALCHLQEKGFIIRSDREKAGGRFTSKGTQLNISAKDWQAIKAEREARRARHRPTDKLSVGEEKPQDILTDGEDDRQTFCPPPTDKLTNGQNVCQTIKNKDDISEPSEEPQEEISLSGTGVRPPVREIPAHEIFGEESNEPLPEEHCPTRAIAIYREIYPTAHLNGEQLEDFAKRLPEVEESVWRQNLLDWKLNRWGSNNLSGIINRYRGELKKWQQQQNQGGTNGNGQIEPHRNGNNSGKSSEGRKPTNFEVSRSRDYSGFEGLDPIATFKT